MSGSFVSPELRAKVRGLAEPIGLAIARTGLSPNALTVIGFLIACVAAVAAGAQAWLLAGLLVIFGGVFDLFDGMVARATGKVSKAGAFLDSTFDRWGEGVVYVGIVVGCLWTRASTSVRPRRRWRCRPPSWSATPAPGPRASGFAPGQGDGQRRPRPARGAARDPHRRPHPRRHAAGQVPLTPAHPARWPTRPTPLVLEAALGLIAVLATITTIQRIVVTLRQASRQG